MMAMRVITYNLFKINLVQDVEYEEQIDQIVVPITNSSASVEMICEGAYDLLKGSGPRSIKM
jgi:hypothetical protein